MRFAFAPAFYLLVGLLAFVFLIVFNQRRKKNILSGFVSAAAYARNAVRSAKEVDVFKSVLMILALFFFIAALAGPQWGKMFESVELQGLRLIFLLDTSSSMQAEDVKPNRFVLAKALILRLTEALKTDMVGLVNFAGTAYCQCPLTMDIDAFKLLLETSEISPREEQGTDFEKAFVAAIRSFQETAGTQNLLIMVTDGEDHEGRWQDQLKTLAKKKIITFTVGIGSLAGVPIPLRNANGQIVDWKKSREGSMVSSRLQEDGLTRIAQETGGKYFRLSAEPGVDRLVQIVKSYNRDTLAQKVRSRMVERYQVPLILALAFLIFEMFLSERQWSWRKK